MQESKNFRTHNMSKLNKIFNTKEMQPITRMWICLQALLSVPVTAADGERRFSEYKLVETYLKSTTCEARLNFLANSSLENMLHYFDISDLVTNFVEVKAKIDFHCSTTPATFRVFRNITIFYSRRYSKSIFTDTLS